MELLNREFTSQSVALAAGLEAKSIQNWATRDLIVGHRGGGKKGVARLFSWFNVMEIACAAALMDLGMKSPQNAFAAATDFAHVSDDVVNENEPRREPGFPYHTRHGRTYIFATGGRSVLRLVHPSQKQSLILIRHDLGNPLGFVSLDISSIFERVMQRLSMDARDVLDEVYPNDAN